MKCTLISLALATPIENCVSNGEAKKFMGRFFNILEHVDSDLGDYTTTAQKLLTDDFHEISDSINMLAGKPLGGVTADKATYITGAQHAPPTTGIESLAITVSDCNNIIWEWNMNGVGQATYPVKGIGMFKMVRSGKLGLNVRAKELKLEFNNIARGLDTGYGWVKQDGTLLGRAPNPTTPATTTDGSSAETSTDGSSTTPETSTDGSSTTPEASTDGSSTTPETSTDGQTTTSESTGTDDSTSSSSDVVAGDSTATTDGSSTAPVADGGVTADGSADAAQ